MREYVVQYNNGRYSCGPIALLNALRFQGHKARRRHLPWLADKLKSTAAHGVKYPQFEKVARQMVGMRRINVPGWRKVGQALVNGNAVAIRVFMVNDTDKGPEYSGHFLLLTAIWIHRDITLYYVVNVGRECRWFTEDELSKRYDKYWDRHYWHKAWIIPQKGKKGLRLPA